MAYKSILTLLDNTQRCAAWTEYAVELARIHGAKLTGIAPREIVSSLDLSELVSANSVWIGEIQNRIDKDADMAVVSFNALCDESDLESFESRIINGSPVDAMKAESVYADLIVMGQYLPGNESPVRNAGLIEALLLGAARPVLLVPAIGTYPACASKVLVAWRDSRESSLALRHSLPLLKNADDVEIVQINKRNNKNSTDNITGDRLIDYLALHGVSASYNEIVSDEDPANMLLSHACDRGANVLVMGGYGHARLKEWALGGVTKTILESMTLPVMMSH